MVAKTLLLTSDAAQLKSLRSQLKLLLRNAGFTAKSQESILLAVGEGVTNAIRHSYGGESGHEIRVVVEDLKDRMVFRIKDGGRKIDLTQLRMPQLPPERGGGLGIYFMKTVVDKMEYNIHRPRGNELILTKYKDKKAA